MEYGSIQAALNAASPGDTVCVNNNGATYDERLSITTADVTLLGAPNGNNVGPASGAPIINPSTGSGPVIAIGADGVTISGFRVTSAQTSTSGIWTNGASLEDVIIRNNEVYNLDGPGVGLPHDSGPVLNNQIIFNSIHDNDAQGVYLATDSGLCSGTDGSNLNLQNNVVANNNIYSNVCNTSCNGSTINLQINCAAGNNVAINNDLHAQSDADPNDDFEMAMYLFNTTGNYITCNTIRDNTDLAPNGWNVAGVRLYHPGDGAGGANLFSYNQFTGNSGEALQDFSGVSIAENNWWGQSPPATSAPNHVSGTDYAPWLTSAAQVSTGCQPPAFTKSFSPSTIDVGGLTELTFTITNNYLGAPLLGIEFTDQLPTGLEYTGTVVSNSCAGTLALTGNGNTLLTFTDGAITALGPSSCEIVVQVQGNTEAVYNNVSTPLITANDGRLGTAAATLIVGNPPIDEEPEPAPADEPAPAPTITDPALSKLGVLGPGELGLPGETITWTITATNTTGAPLTNVVISDTFLSELAINTVQASTGTVATMGQTVTVSVPYISPGDVVTVEVNTTVRSTPADGLFTNEVTLQADGGVSLQASGVVMGVSGLPSTGYPPGE